MSVTLLVVGPFLAFLAAVILTRLGRFLLAASRIPGPPASFLIGNAPLLWCAPEKIAETASELLDQYGSTVRLWIGPLLAVFVSDSTDIQIILCENKLTKRPLVFRALRRLFGKSVVTTDGPVWAAKRSFTARSMTGKRVEEFHLLLCDHASKFVAKVLEKGADDATVELYNLMTRCTFDSFCEFFFAQVLDDDQAEHCLSNMQFQEEVILECSLRPWLLVDWIFDRTSLGKKFNQSCEELRSAILELLRLRRSPFTKELYSLPGITEKEACDDAVTLSAAAEESSSTALSSFFLMMALHPDIQERLVSELVESSKDSPFLEACIYEVLRLFSPLPYSIRCAETDLRLHDHMIPAGAIIYVVYAKMHRDPALFPEPERFNPDRFMDGGAARAHIGFRPFAAGPRSCIGQRYAMNLLKGIISEVLPRVEFLPAPGLSKMDDIRLSVLVTTKVNGGYKVRVRPRS